MHQNRDPEPLDHDDLIDTLLRESLAIADVIAETDSGVLASHTIPILGSLLRTNLRKIDKLFPRHINRRKEQRK